MSNLDQLFAPTNVINEPAKKETSYEFNPSAKNVQGGVYQAIVRFVPWHKDPSKSIMSKYQAFVKDPVSQKGRYIDSLKNVGKDCPIVNTFWELYNTKMPSLQDFAKKHLSYSEIFVSLVQVISDEHHPELVGKILPWRFKKTVWEKLYNEQHPQMGVGSNPFDIINGRYFAIKVVLKNGWNNYDNCGFFDYKTANGSVGASAMLMVNPATNAYEPVTTMTDRQSVYNYLVNNSPDLSIYDHREWTPEDTQFVMGVCQTLKTYAQTGNIAQNVAVATGAPTTNPVVNVAPTMAAPTPSMPAMPQFESTTNSAPSMPQMPQMNVPQMNVPQMNANVSFSNPAMPAGTSITGVDLPDQSMSRPTPPPTATPMPSGLNLQDIYNDL